MLSYLLVVPVMQSKCPFIVYIMVTISLQAINEAQMDFSKIRTPSEIILNESWVDVQMFVTQCHLLHCCLVGAGYACIMRLSNEKCIYVHIAPVIWNNAMYCHLCHYFSNIHQYTWNENIDVSVNKMFIKCRLRGLAYQFTINAFNMSISQNPYIKYFNYETRQCMLFQGDTVIHFDTKKSDRFDFDAKCRIFDSHV